MTKNRNQFNDESVSSFTRTSTSAKMPARKNIRPSSAEHDPDPVDNKGKHIKTGSGKTSARKTQVDQAIATQCGRLDKLILVLPRTAMSDDAAGMVADRLAANKAVKKVSSKRDSYQKKFVLLCPSGTKVVFGVLPADQRMRFSIRMTLNPAQMELADARALYELLRQIFVPNWKAVLRQFLVQRVDQAYDHPVSISNLIVQATGMPVEEKYYVSSDRFGQVQTWYCGSVESQERYATYDQLASDDYKIAHGEKPSRPAARHNAEGVITRQPGPAAMTRFESRRVFKQPLAVAEVDEKAPPFGRFVIYEVTDEQLAAAPEFFFLYLDSVRLRGVAGARKEFERQCPDRAGKKRLIELETYLSQCMAPWWDKSGLNCSVRRALMQTPARKVLRPLLK